MAPTAKSPRASREALPLLLAVLLVALLGSAVLVRRNWDSLRAVMLYVTGRAGACTLSESVRAVHVTARQVSGTRRMRSGMSLERSETGGPFLFRTPLGRYWLPSDAAKPLESFAYELSEQARDIYSSDKSGVLPGDVVLDCGASTGVFTRQALFRGARLVIAIEPEPRNLECLRRNLAGQIAAGRVIAYPKGVWDKEDFLTFGGRDENPTQGSVLATPDSNSIRVPLTTIDHLVSELGLERVDFVKMDIEGAEKQALAGARNTIAKFKPRMAICVYHLREDPVDIPRLVRGIDPTYRTECQCLNYEKYIEAEVAHFYH